MVKSYGLVGARAASMEAFVIEAPPDVREATWAAVQAMPVYPDRQMESRELQTALHNALCRQVPGWLDLVGRLEDGLESQGIVLVRGLRFDAENRLAVGLISALGSASGYGNVNSRVVYDLFPIERPPGTPDFELFFHTGSQTHQRPHEVQVLECVKPGSQGGGVSRLAQLEVALDTMRQQGKGWAIETLRNRPCPFKIPAWLGGGLRLAPVLEQNPGAPDRTRVRFQREPILDGAAEQPAGLDQELSAAINAFESTLNTPGSFVEYPLQAGEYLAIDNRAVLHARTAVRGGRESSRHLKRIKAYRPAVQ